MSEDCSKLIAEIEARAGTIASFIASFRNRAEVAGRGMSSSGKLYFKYPSRLRSEGLFDEKRIINVSTAETSQRYFIDEKMIWRTDLKELGAAGKAAGISDLLNMGASDPRDPFRIVDRKSLEYGGLSPFGSSNVNLFTGRLKSGLFQWKGLYSRPIDVGLSIDASSCLLVRLTCRSLQSPVPVLFEMSYEIEAVDVPLDDSLFTLDGLPSDIKRMDVTGIEAAALSGDIHRQGASKN